LPEGTFETALLYVREVFSEETMGVGDTEFWVEIEKKAGLFNGSSKEAIFQFYLRGSTHVTLATALLKSFPRYRAGIGLGDIGSVERETMTSRLAAVIYEDFPPRYKRTHRKDAYS